MVGFSDAVASAGPRANNLHLAPDRQPHLHLINSIFTGRMLFLTPNQQCQSTEGNSTEAVSQNRSQSKFSVIRLYSAILA